MITDNKTGKFLNNLFFAFTAQGVSLTVSFLMSLIVPKLLGVTEFGYWQLFIFYSSYVGFFLFGINDGIYLRAGGKKYNELNFSLLGSQFWISMVAQTLIALGVALYAIFFINNNSRVIVLISVALYLLLFNASGYIGYIFQSVNLTKLYSISLIIEKVFFIVSIIFLLLIKKTHFEIFVVFYLCGKFLCLAYSLYIGNKIVFTHLIISKKVFYEIWENISVGSKLMAANIAGTLVLGIGQFFIDHKWGINTFGKISFSLSLTNFFLVFLAQFSMVLFPALRQTNSENLKDYYRNIRDSFGIVFSVIPLFYFPIKYILDLWLPQYSVSIHYMIFLLPLCIFEGKMQILCNTYLKVLRKEKTLLIVNIVALLLSIILIMLSTYAIKNVITVVISMVIAVVFRSVIAEYYLSKLLRISTFNHLIQELLLSVIFIITAWLAPATIAFSVYLTSYILYIILNKSKVQRFKQIIKGMIKKHA